MKVKSKITIAIILVGIVAGILLLQKSNESLYKGQILGRTDENPGSNTKNKNEQPDSPDLKGKLEIMETDTNNQNIQVKALIINQGTNILNGGANPFKYAIYLEKAEVFSNLDSYSVLAPGESFDFTYPISKDIYKYSNNGKITLKIDMDNTVNESDENNNEVSAEFNLDHPQDTVVSPAITE